MNLQVEEERVLDDLAGVEVGWEPEPHSEAAHLGGEGRRPGHPERGPRHVAATTLQQHWRFSSV